jgi:hypothetical protein
MSERGLQVNDARFVTYTSVDTTAGILICCAIDACIASGDYALVVQGHVAAERCVDLVAAVEVLENSSSSTSKRSMG